MKIYKSSYTPVRRPRAPNPLDMFRHRRKRRPYRRVRYPRSRLLTSKKLLFNTGYARNAKKMARKPFRPY